MLTRKEMKAAGSDSSSEPTAGQNAMNAPETSLHRDLGPDLKPLGKLQRSKSIWTHILKHHRSQIVIIIVALPMLLIGVYAWDELRTPIQFQNAITVPTASPSTWADWWIRIQSFLGIPTLLVALFVWYGEIREDWENDLPKRMSVFFFYGDKPAIVCRHVWLAGAEDLRAWGQQVAAQAAEVARLEFTPDVIAREPSLAVLPNGKTICKHYVVRFQLTKPPPSLPKESSLCLYQNFAAIDKYVHPIPIAQAEALRVVADWQNPAKS
jgi:hypothetical protein